MLRNSLLYFLLFVSISTLGQDILAFQQARNLNFAFVEPIKKQQKRFNINHQPFLVLTVSPLNAFQYNNNLMVGAELAPPGKFSLQADYGKGSGSMNVRKAVREQYADMKTSIMRSELKGYLSDWYFFSDLDRKPLGRYWAIEYVQRSVDMERTVATGELRPDYILSKTALNSQQEKAINLKYGFHWLVKRFVIFDIYGGFGFSRYKVKSSLSETEDVLFYFNPTKYKNWLPNQKGFVPNFTGGVRFCLAL